MIVFVRNCGVSLITRICSFFFQSVWNHGNIFNKTSADIEIEAKVQSIQLDNQLSNVEFPMILCGSPKNETHS